ncbi:SMI1/KNR4 family protein [Entomospira culicis]|uniref:SMI1/KNR4 family protein n=1 Tax=Entomospira culicis TaxID=2719989 RepID=A0A968GLT8_9SPIO|nr:SMI1/KNR4 family protein [Entomospira culicis]NIZ19893.1 SMI1/KNR4 family protein [Entomospira culicis]NIZ70150.1 SMI1/KNR4 family protein [Entomospira culicis]WDI37983.1 SMI1/KNR4 family protein [Entomospira culicis]WDI39606.1 SMI1/KNR4 family protein [Entomospira culicis]
MAVSWNFVEPITEPSIVTRYLEAQKVILPTEIIQHILAYNGGAPTPSCFDSPYGQEHEVGYLLSYLPDSAQSVYSVRNALIEEHHIPHLFPLMDDNFGNYICYDTQENRIVYWLHEEHIYATIAENWEEFISNLY